VTPCVWQKRLRDQGISRYVDEGAGLGRHYRAASRGRKAEKQQPGTTSGSVGAMVVPARRRRPGAIDQAVADADTFFAEQPTLLQCQFGSEGATKIKHPVLSVLGTRSARVFHEGRETRRAIKARAAERGHCWAHVGMGKRRHKPAWRRRWKRSTSKDLAKRTRVFILEPRRDVRTAVLWSR
jgi:hypothetical protein